MYTTAIFGNVVQKYQAQVLIVRNAKGFTEMLCLF